MTKYNNGKFYKIEPVCDYDEGDIYIGSTTHTRLCERMTKHRYDYKKWKQGSNSKITVFDIFDKYGLENCKILLLENFSCDTRDELQAKEGHYIRTLKCVNRITNGRTREEYREDNKEKKAVTDKLYYEKNKEELLKKNHDRYMKNREENILKLREYRIAHLQEEKDRAKLYRQNNQEQCKERDRLKYLKNKERLNELVICSCGCSVSRQQLRTHEKTKKHINLINNQDIIKISS